MSPMQQLLNELYSVLDSKDKITQNDMSLLSHWLTDNLEQSPLMPNTMYESLSKNFKDFSVELSSNKNQIDIVNRKIHLECIPYPPVKTPKFTFIDLFAGMGGFRQAMQSHDGKCVFSSEWDKYAAQTYFENYGEMPYGDIRQVDPNDIPDHDILCGGFPCQPFSLAGVSKKNSLGIKHGFEDETQGTLFFNVAKILKTKRPKAFFLENVKNLFRHDKGKTFEIIRRTLEEELGYCVQWKVVNASPWVPQRRERLFIVGFDPKQIDVTDIEDLIPTTPINVDYEYKSLSSMINKSVPEKYTLGPGTWSTLQRHKKHHADAGNGFGYKMHSLPLSDTEITRTISARYHKDGAEILIEQPGKRPRKLTVKEAMQLQGYDHNKFRFPVSNTQAYKQIGNSVVVPLIKDVSSNIVSKILP